jgi:hypothetical protein
MLFEALEVLKWAPKVTLVYVGTAMLNGLAISNIFLGVTIFLDILDYIL